MDESGLELRRVVRKELLDGTKMLKKLSDAFKDLLQNKSSFDLEFRYSKARKVAAQAVKMSKKRSCEEFGRQLDSNYLSANKVFWLPFADCEGKV